MSSVHALRCFMTIAVTACCLGVSGCATLPSSIGDLFAESDADNAQLAEDVPQIAIEFYPTSGRPERLKMPLKDVTYIQQALEESGALRRFGRQELKLVRARPDGGGKHKLDIAFDRSSQRVPPKFDYALHPGDRLIVIQDTSNIVDDMLGTVSGPLSNLIPD